MKTAVLRALRLVFTHAPGVTTLTILLVVIQGLLPLAALYVMKLIVDSVTAGIAAADKAPVTSHLLLLLAAAAAIALLLAICRAVAGYATEVQSLFLTDIITDKIQEHSIHLDLAYYENPAYHDSLHRAQMEGPSRPSRIVNDLVQIGQNCISIGAIGGFILAFSPFVGIILIGAALPAAVVRVWYSRRLYELRLRQTEPERKSRYYHMMMGRHVPCPGDPSVRPWEPVPGTLPLAAGIHPHRPARDLPLTGNLGGPDPGIHHGSRVRILHGCRPDGSQRDRLTGRSRHVLHGIPAVYRVHPDDLFEYECAL